jgi:hypothetical protein
MTRLLRPLWLLPILVLLAVSLGAIAAASPAAASSTQVTIMEQDSLLKTNLSAGLADFKSLGVDVIPFEVNWDAIAPDPNSTRVPAHYNGSNPADDPARNWEFLDSFVRGATADGFTVALTLDGPAPRWAEGYGLPRGDTSGSWRPNPNEFGAFARAVATRYSGHYTPRGAHSPLPAVRFWMIWNEPNYGGGNLTPETLDGGRIQSAANLYRELVAQAWSSLMSTGHRGNTILFGQTAPHGRATGGVYLNEAPLRFIQALYCTNVSFQELRGSLARANGCPTTPAASRRFRAENPGLFQSSGFAAHLYSQDTVPGKLFDDRCTTGQDRAEYADLGTIAKLEATLVRLRRLYGSPARVPLWDTEFGYQTDPPQAYSCKGNSIPISPALAAYYMNWAEYIHYQSPYMESYDQYELVDAANGQFATGLELFDGRALPGLGAFRTPLFMPQTSGRAGQPLIVWGGVRPAPVDGVSRVQIQFQTHDRGAWRTVRTVSITNPRGYIDVRQGFGTSGSVRLEWVDPLSGVSYTSRQVQLSIR